MHPAWPGPQHNSRLQFYRFGLHPAWTQARNFTHSFLRERQNTHSHYLPYHFLSWAGPVKLRFSAAVRHAAFFYTMLSLIVFVLRRLARRLFRLVHAIIRQTQYRRGRKHRRPAIRAVSAPFRRSQPKPAWVKDEILRLAALSGSGCRKVAILFNRLHATSRKMTVSKSFAHYTMRNHRYEIEVLRREIRNRPPRTVPKNCVWAIDMTGKGDTRGTIHSISGILDHGSRRLLSLESLPNKNAWTLLGHLFLAIGQYGKPQILRSDNEAVFRSKVFRFGCKFAGIRQQFTVPGCPWMNGRIERLFGTLKSKLDWFKIDGGETLNCMLAEFRLWYNAVRPHQHLAGLTPDEAWHGINPYACSPKSVQRVEAWDGLLKGIYLRY